MDFLELMEELSEHNKTGKGYQIHLNSGNLEEKSNRNIGIEFSDLYFNICGTLRNSTLLCFGNVISKSENELYPLEFNNVFIDINKIESIEEVNDHEDWFELPSKKVFNLYMFPENNTLTGKRNVLSIGFLE